MCCLFGLIDYKGGLSYQQRKRIIRALAIEGEQRGTDATGYAWYHNGRIIIKKSSKAAHEYQVHMPRDVKVVMGHTRLTTQGNYHNNRNNHHSWDIVRKTALLWHTMVSSMTIWN